MPYKFDTEKLKIPVELDRRRRLTPVVEAYILSLYDEGVSIREITRLVHPLSRRTVQFVIFPERRVRAAQLGKARQATRIYYDKDKHKEYIKNTRQYKKLLYDDNKLEKL